MEAVKLGVVTGGALKTGDVHGEKGHVGRDESEPEVPAAEGIVHEAATY